MTERASTNQVNPVSDPVCRRLGEMGLQLPGCSVPLGAYVPAYLDEKTGLLYVSGQGPIADGRALVQGVIGADLDVIDGRNAARSAILSALSVMNQTLGGLGRIRQIIRLTGYIRCAPIFTDLPRVLDGASELLVDIWGKHGQHARSVVGVVSLPLGIPIEIDVIAAVR